MRVELHYTPGELRHVARRERNGRVAVRLLAVASAMEHKTAPQVASELGVGRRAVQDWVRWYNDGGIASLRDGSMLVRASVTYKVRPNLALYALDTEIVGGNGSELAYLQVARVTTVGARVYF